MSLSSRLDKLEASVPLTDAQRAEYDGLTLLELDRQSGSLIECLDDGFVRLVDYMGDDSSIVQAARVSYGAGTKTVNDDRGLIRYLLRHQHTTPLEMVEFKFHIRMPMDAWRQHIRHRTASVNEYSTRYSEAIDSMQATDDAEWRLQGKGNKQGSSGMLENWPAELPQQMEDHIGCARSNMTPGEYLSWQEEELHEMATRIYQERLALGVAREQARKDLPLSNYTEAYWKIDLHNLFHFLRLRMDSHAQLEIRTYANAMAEIIKPIVPAAWEAFEDYRIRSMTFSGPEIEFIKYLLHPEWALRMKAMSKREIDEFKTKVSILGLPDERFQEFANLMTAA